MDSEPIYVYSRKQALADGYQVKLEAEYAQMAREAGWRVSVYLTHSVYSLIGQNKGILWDILCLAYFKARSNRDSESISFTASIAGASHQLLAKIGATDIDDPAPALTIMIAGED